MKKRKGEGFLEFTGFVFIILLVMTALAFLSNSLRAKYDEAERVKNAPRSITVYGSAREPIRQWQGKFDVKHVDGGISFVSDDKPVIIQGGIIVNEEM